MDITAAIAAQKDLLLNFGGHPMAAGLALEADTLPVFRRRLNKTVETMLGNVRIIGQLEIDGWFSLSDISFDLAAALECLAPFGPGNEKLVLAAPRLKLNGSTVLGRNQEHLKWTVSDEAGNSQTVFWWNGAGEIQPQGRFDLAFTVRAIDWHGLRQLQLEFVDFRAVDAEVIEVDVVKRQVVDYRSVEDPVGTLKEIQQIPATVVWAEGPRKNQVQGLDRNQLKEAETLVIWTPPPSNEELCRVIANVNPRTVHLFAAALPEETPETFLIRLGGLLKYAQNHRNGKVTCAELAAATAQREATVRYGLEWYATQGILAFKSGLGEELTILAGTGLADASLAARLYHQIQLLLDETAAYRTHYRHAPADALMP